MAVAVLTDSAKISEIEEAVSTEDEETVEDAVKVAYSTKARELQEAVAASAQRVIDAEKARLEAGVEAAEIRAREREDAEGV